MAYGAPGPFPRVPVLCVRVHPGVSVRTFCVSARASTRLGVDVGSCCRRAAVTVTMGELWFSHSAAHWSRKEVFKILVPRPLDQLIRISKGWGLGASILKDSSGDHAGRPQRRGSDCVGDPSRAAHSLHGACALEP